MSTFALHVRTLTNKDLVDACLDLGKGSTALVEP